MNQNCQEHVLPSVGSVIYTSVKEARSELVNTTLWAPVNYLVTLSQHMYTIKAIHTYNVDNKE